jgi:tRNA threonylcarbamoyladenosine biosynthesis protein TsaB
MRILALETTERTGSLAAMNDGNLLAELSLEPKQRSAQSLAPAIRTLLKQAEWLPDDVQVVAVAQGPGSFTGLRIGVTTAKLFAYAVGAAILGVDTLEAIAAAAPEDVAKVSAVMDAQRGEVVARAYVRRSDGWFEPMGPARLLDIRTWLKELPPEIAVSGPVLNKLTDPLPPGVRMLDPQYWSPRASAVARLAARDYALGHRDDLWKLVPRYCRRSAAEEKLGVGATPAVTKGSVLYRSEE